MITPTFILGAGFNADAAGEAGRQQHDSGYPLVGDMLRLCFNLPAVPDGKSIEDLFSDALERDPGPIRKLADRLRQADHDLAYNLAQTGGLNCYQRFFRAYRDSSFLTFNYDSLPETLLFHLGCWFPRDGYGVKVMAHLPPGSEEFGDKTSSALVLHLHGSLCIRTSEFELRSNGEQATAMLTERDAPLFAFDPTSITGNFAPFDRDVGFDDVKDRIIAPVPDKSQGLKQTFIRAIYAKAVDVVRDSGAVVAIGYSFNAHDRGSYQTLLDALRESKGRRLLIVSPDADIVAQPIRAAFPDLAVIPLKATFKEWVAELFPGIETLEEGH